MNKLITPICTNATIHSLAYKVFKRRYEADIEMQLLFEPLVNSVKGLGEHSAAEILMALYLLIERKS